MRRYFKRCTPGKVFAVAFLGIVLCLFGYFALVLFVLMGNPFDKDPFDDMTFDRAAWLEDATCCDGSNRRGHMSEDMIARYLKTDTSKADVERLLGRNDGEVKFKHGYVPSPPVYFTTLTPRQFTSVDESYIYYVGEEQGHHIDRAWLNVFFHNGRYLGSAIGFPQ